MQEYFGEIKKRIIELEEIIKKVSDRLPEAPSGTLRIGKSNNKVQYYHRDGGRGDNGKYIPLSRKNLVCALAQKSYDEELLKVAKSEYELLQNFLSTKFKLPEQVFSSLSPQRQQLVVPEIITDAEYAKQWLMQEYEGLPFDDNAPEFYTGKGERVRSKSEIVIADILKRNEYPYLYERPLYFGDGSVKYPDFTVLNVRERKEIYLEHLGMMDDEVYLMNSLNKIASYERNDIYLGDRLIVTYETSKRPLNTKEVEKKLRFFLD